MDELFLILDEQFQTICMVMMMFGIGIVVGGLIRGKQVVRSFEEEVVTRIKISLDSVRAQVLGQKLADAGCKSWDKREIVDVDFNDSDDRIIRFTIVPKELNLTVTDDKKSEKGE